MSGPGAADMPSLQKACRGFRLHLMKPRVKEAVLRPAGFGETTPANDDICLETEMSQTALKNHDSEFKSLTFQKRGQINLLTASLSGVTAQLTKTPRNSGRSTHVVCMTRL